MLINDPRLNFYVNQPIGYQDRVLMGELGELITALADCYRNDRREDQLKRNITEEMADVLICISISARQHNISESDINSVVCEKLVRRQ